MTWKTAALLTAGALAAGACVQILGNDFVVITDDGGDGGGGSGSTSSSAGGGGTGGSGSGGAPLTTYNCEWLLPNHRKLVDLEGTNQFFSNVVTAVQRDADQARFVVQRNGGSVPDQALLFTAGESGGFAMNTWDSDEIHQMDRISTEHIGILYDREGANGLELVLRLVSDSSADGAQFVDEEVVAYQSAFADLTATFLNASFTVVSGSIGNPIIDIFAWWRKNDNTYRLGYARYSGNPINTFTQVTASDFTEDEDVNLVALNHHEGVTYAWIGADSTLGMRRIEISAQTTFPVTPTPVGAAGQFVFNYGSGPQNTRFLQFSFGPPLELLTARVPNDDLGSYDFIDGMKSVGSWQEVHQVPVLLGTHSWHGGLHVMVGSPLPDPNDPDVVADFSYWLIDDNGNQRGLATLPSSAQLAAGETRSGNVLGGTTVPVGDNFDANGGRLHTFWEEYHDTANDQFFAVVYYDQLVCDPVLSN